MVILELYWGDIGDILGFYWRYIGVKRGGILRLYWSNIGDILGRY